MSKHNWPELTRERDAAPETDTAEWLAALADLDDPDEWEEAMNADPLLLFQGLPEEETGPQDVAAMKVAVSSMRRTHELESGVRRRRTRERARYGSLAALLALALSAATLTGTAAVDSVSSPEIVTMAEASEVDLNGLDFEAAMMPAVAVPLEIAQLPLVEDVDPELGTFMQIEDDGVSLVVVMAEGPEPAVGDGA